MVLVLFFVTNLQPFIDATSQVPCYFIFGDSEFDCGNNNGFTKASKSNYPPYGIDFPDGPTGRFTNGRTQADLIGQFLGFDNFIPPFANTSGQDILKGVNYASGGGGILNETGKTLGDRISMDMQLQNHETTIKGISNLLGSSGAAESYLASCIYLVGMGSNDYINNYLLPESYNSSQLYTPNMYATILAQNYAQQLRTLYNFGARKVAIVGLGLIGCALPEIVLHDTNIFTCAGNCVTKDAEVFNIQLKSLVDQLNNDLLNANFIYINVSGITTTYLAADAKSGVTLKYGPCCNTDLIVGRAECIPNSVPCSNRTMYKFWDAFHTTEVVNILLAKGMYNAQTPFDAYPFDIVRLALL
ncbi:hypothetical protein Vadar_006965 [Vaccinium darrowii]|uniref:Uncharacterized protein n=1 Tax=Vaccinium darrowii TaxID=229202 RepID=A0ACB7XGZ9_9ERIC|nr:hypothetical protein Vadar_006965 [Vaccinium darrowii]